MLHSFHILPRSEKHPNSNALPVPAPALRTTIGHDWQAQHPAARDPAKPRSSALSMFSIRLSGEKPEPKPYYYNRMNPQELFVWEIIGEQKCEWVRDRKGKLHKRRLSPKDRAARQKMFYDTRVGHGVCGDDWMRKALPKRAP